MTLKSFHRHFAHILVAILLATFLLTSPSTTAPAFAGECLTVSSGSCTS